MEKFRSRVNITEATCTEDVDGDPGPRHEADGQAGQTKQHTFLESTFYFHQGHATSYCLLKLYNLIKSDIYPKSRHKCRLSLRCDEFHFRVGNC
jgi:hypothetical protein